MIVSGREGKSRNFQRATSQIKTTPTGLHHQGCIFFRWRIIHLLLVTSAWTQQAAPVFQLSHFFWHARKYSCVPTTTLPFSHTPVFSFFSRCRIIIVITMYSELDTNLNMEIKQEQKKNIEYSINCSLLFVPFLVYNI